jgi:hypothetical protein
MSTTWYIRIQPTHKLTKKEDLELRARIAALLDHVVRTVEDKQEFGVSLSRNKKEMTISAVKQDLAKVVLLTDKEVKEV